MVGVHKALKEAVQNAIHIGRKFLACVRNGAEPGHEAWNILTADEVPAGSQPDEAFGMIEEDVALAGKFREGGKAEEFLIAHFTRQPD